MFLDAQGIRDKKELSVHNKMFERRLRSSFDEYIA